MALYPLPAAWPDSPPPRARPVGFLQGTLHVGWLLPPMGIGTEALALTPTLLGFSLPAFALTPVSHSTDRFKPHLMFQRAAEHTSRSGLSGQTAGITASFHDFLTAVKANRPAGRCAMTLPGAARGWQVLCWLLAADSGVPPSKLLGQPVGRWFKGSCLPRCCGQAVCRAPAWGWAVAFLWARGTSSFCGVATEVLYPLHRDNRGGCRAVLRAGRCGPPPLPPCKNQGVLAASLATQFQHHRLLSHPMVCFAGWGGLEALQHFAFQLRTTGKAPLQSACLATAPAF